MKKVKDKFSKQAEAYKKYRPQYPKELFDEILSLTEGRDACWDCGTGNGQVAVVLSRYFTKVYATDVSENQILNAEKKDNIIYSVERAESTSFENDQFDLITVAQAIHWFDFHAFNKEAKRVGKDGGIISVWGYGRLEIEKPVNQLIDQFYRDIVGAYWNAERKHIENEYRSIPFDFPGIKLKKQFFIKTAWTLAELEGYFNSWSSVQNYKNKNGENPVNWIMERIGPHWERGSKKEIRFPIFIRIGKIQK